MTIGALKRQIVGAESGGGGGQVEGGDCTTVGGLHPLVQCRKASVQKQFQSEIRQTDSKYPFGGSKLHIIQTSVIQLQNKNKLFINV